MSPKYVVSGIFAAVLVMGTLVMSASAQRDRKDDRPEVGDERCKRELIKAGGKAAFAVFSRQRELEGRGAAMQNAITNWQREVRAKYGEQWMQYEQASDTGKDCQPSGIGVVGRRIIRCTISGRPCKIVTEVDQASGTKGGDGDGRYRKGDIREAQRLLNACFQQCDIQIDGVLGDQTADCLKTFQRRYDLRRTGEPDEATMQALRRRCRRS
jgi:hypothetical protein